MNQDDIDKKLKFVEAMTKHGLKHTSHVDHLALGGLSGGVGNAILGQNSFQANLAPTSNTDYSGAINNSSANSEAGYGNFQNIQGQQQQTANQLQAESLGEGPNPAANELAQATGANVANQAALAAGQRGASSNAGLIARQAAQSGAGIQQNAAGQAATLNSQQQLAAQQQLEQQQANLASGNTQEQAANNQLFGAASGAQNAQNNTAVNNYAQMQGINSQIAQNNTNNLSNTIGGVFNGASSILSALAKGGVAGKDGYEHLHTVAKLYHPKHYDVGGSVSPVGGAPSIPQATGSIVGTASDPMAKQGDQSGGDDKGGGALGLLALLKDGGKVKGKPEFKGDNKKNDVVPAMLSKGELVVDNETMQDPGPMGQMARALAMHIQSKNKGKKK
jgi:hypothetical protein